MTDRDIARICNERSPGSFARRLERRKQLTWFIYMWLVLAALAGRILWDFRRE